MQQQQSNNHRPEQPTVVESDDDDDEDDKKDKKVMLEELDIDIAIGKLVDKLYGTVVVMKKEKKTFPPS